MSMVNYSIGDTIQFRRLGSDLKERGVLVNKQGIGANENAMTMFIVKLPDSAQVAYLTYEEIECTIVHGFYATVEAMAQI